MSAPHPAQAGPRPIAGYHLAVLVLTLLALFLYGEIPYASEAYATTDLYHYRQMAAAAPALAVDVQQPYVFRPLGPYLAGLLPLPDVVAFRILTWLAAILLGQLLFAYLRTSGIRAGIALLVTTFFLLSKHLFGVHVWSFFQLADLFSFIALIAMLWALSRERWLLFGLAFLAGILSKETALLMAPTALAYLWQQGRLRQEGPRLLAALLPGAAAFIALRLLIQPAGGLGLFAAFLRYAPKLGQPAIWFRLLVNPFIPFTFLPLVFWRESLAFLRARLHLVLLLALVFLSTLFGGNNERLMAPAFIVFYPLLAHLIQERLAGQPWLLAGLSFCALAAGLHHEIGRFPLPDRTFVLALSLGALALATALALVAAFGRALPGPRLPASGGRFDKPSL